MRELTLKELAPYLPYSLNIIYGNNSITICEMTIDKVSANKMAITQVLEIEAYKPILRPMSDFDKMCNEFDLLTDFDSCYISSNSDLACTNTGDKTYLSDMLTVTNFLFENHFDVFNLIPDNLAISIHDLKQ